MKPAPAGLEPGPTYLLVPPSEGGLSSDGDLPTDCTGAHSHATRREHGSICRVPAGNFWAFHSVFGEIPARTATLVVLVVLKLAATKKYYNNEGMI